MAENASAFQPERHQVSGGKAPLHPDSLGELERYSVQIPGCNKGEEGERDGKDGKERKGKGGRKGKGHKCKKNFFLRFLFLSR